MLKAGCQLALYRQMVLLRSYGGDGCVFAFTSYLLKSVVACIHIVEASSLLFTRSFIVPSNYLSKQIVGIICTHR